MIAFDDKAASRVYIGDRVISAVYAGDELIWQPWSTEDIWRDTYISRQFLNVNGQSAISTNGDRYEVYNGDARDGDVLKFEWDDVIVGTNDTYPTIRVCFFDRFGRFIAPRYSYTATSIGRYIVTVPSGAISVDVRIDDRSSSRLQGFSGFRMYKN